MAAACDVMARRKRACASSPTPRTLASCLVLRYNSRMNATLKITKIGNSAGVVLPKEVLARLRVGPGDTLHLTEAPDGMRLTAADPEFAADMEMAEEIMRRDRNILRALAK
jgi:putative addiction module antidote